MVIQVSYEFRNLITSAAFESLHWQEAGTRICSQEAKLGYSKLRQRHLNCEAKFPLHGFSLSHIKVLGYRKSRKFPSRVQTKCNMSLKSIF